MLVVIVGTSLGSMRMFVRVFVVAVCVLVLLVVHVRAPFVNAKLDAAHILPLLPLEVHVKVANVQLRKLPLERRWFHAQIAQGADGHVAADAGEAVEEENFHGCGSSRASRTKASSESRTAPS